MAMIILTIPIIFPVIVHLGFDPTAIPDLAKALGWSQDLTGAKLVGRYKSGCPIEQRKFQAGPYTPPSTDPGDPNHGNPALANSNTLNNNFEFADDPQGANCPMSAHIRKAYPRDAETPAGAANSESATQTHRLLRRGIPYGESYHPQVPGSGNVDRGLLFFAYQSDIASQFEFVQNAWINNPAFPPNPAGQPPLSFNSWQGQKLTSSDVILSILGSFTSSDGPNARQAAALHPAPRSSPVRLTA
jgi:hypothetical protein